MKEILTAIQIPVSILLITSILLQARGTGLSATWGGGGETFQSRRGVEKVLFTATIIFSILFFIIQTIILIS